MPTEKDLQQKYIGLIIVAYNYLDWQLNAFIGWLICDDVKVGQIVTTYINSFAIRLNLLFSLYKNQASQLKWFERPLKEDTFTKRDQLVEALYTWVERAHEVNAKRNTIIHSVWFQQQRHLEELGEDSPMTSIDVRAEKSKSIQGGRVGLKYEVIGYSATELEQFAIEIKILTNDLESLKASTQTIQEKVIG